MFFVQQPIINPNKENLTFFEGIMLGLQEALAYESDKVRKAPVHSLAKQCGSLREAITTLSKDI